MDYELLPNINDTAHFDARNATQKHISVSESSVVESQCANEFWKSTLPNKCHILSMKPDDDCFFHCISDQFNHDMGLVMNTRAPR
jgi:hypothetical protein